MKFFWGKKVYLWASLLATAALLAGCMNSVDDNTPHLENRVAKQFTVCFPNEYAEVVKDNPVEVDWQTVLQDYLDMMDTELVTFYYYPSYGCRRFDCNNIMHYHYCIEDCSDEAHAHTEPIDTNS